MYLDRFNLKGRVAVVTGGAQGIGLACVEALSEAGAYVYIADRNLKIAQEAQAAMKAKGYAADVIEMEVTDSKQVDAAAARVMAEKGRVDILVCNAGIARSETPAEDVTDEHWLNVIDVNLNGLFWCCRAFGKTHAGGGARLDHQHRLDVRIHRQQAAAAGLLQRFKSGRASSDEIACGRMGRARRSGQRRRADLYQHADDRSREDQ